MGRFQSFSRRCLLLLLCALLLPAAASGAETANAPSQDVMNILLIGQDAYPGAENSRSDSILLCTFHPESRTMTITSILRDLYVPIEGHRSNRINAAYAFGGMSLLKKTVEQNFGIMTDGCVEINFASFPELIDLLGGVTMTLRADEANAINSSVAGTLTEGVCLLNGSQALAYVRIRKLDDDGDFSRTRRQQKLLTALLEGYRNATPAQIFRLLKEGLSLVKTDMDTGDILRSARKFVPILSGLTIRHGHIPAEGTYEYKTIRGMSVLVADLNAARALLQQIQQP